MIQRIQTLFWILAAGGIALMFVSPMAKLSSNPELSFWLNGFMAEGAEEYARPTWPLGALGVVIMLINLITIFLFKKRELQMRLTIYTMILIVGLVGLGVFYLMVAAKDFNGDIKLMYFSVMPIVSLILNYLAWRGVRKDFLMLKAVDRIR